MITVHSQLILSGSHTFLLTFNLLSMFAWFSQVHFWEPYTIVLFSTYHLQLQLIVVGVDIPTHGSAWNIRKNHQWLADDMTNIVTKLGDFSNAMGTFIDKVELETVLLQFQLNLLSVKKICICSAYGNTFCKIRLK